MSLKSHIITRGGPLRRVILSKPQDGPVSHAKLVDLNHAPVELTSLAGSSNVLKLDFGDRLSYFRRCRPHEDLREYVRSFLIDWGEVNQNAALANLVLEELDNASNWRSFTHMGVRYDASSPVSRFFKTHDFAEVGLGGLTGIVYYEDVKGLISSCWSELYAHELNSGCKRHELQTYNAVRTLATETLACHLGLSELIPHAEYAKLAFRNKGIAYGVLMRDAGGINVNHWNAERRARLVTGDFQRQLTNLNALDVLSHEKDHRPDNYNVQLDASGKANGLVAFDNDSPASFAPVPNVSFTTYAGASPFVKASRINRPHFDANLYENMHRMDWKQLESEISAYLTTLQVKALKGRFARLLKALEETARHDDRFLLDDMQWGAETLLEEYSGRYGTTYLTLFTPLSPDESA